MSKEKGEKTGERRGDNKGGKPRTEKIRQRGQNLMKLFI